MSDNEQHKRRFERLQLDLSGEDAVQQSSGLAVTLFQTGMFGKFICSGVLKDISEGGAGILIPRRDSLNEFINIKFANKFKLAVQVCYRRPISARLEFVGIQWNDVSVSQIAKVMRIVESIKQSAAPKEQQDIVGENTTYEE